MATKTISLKVDAYDRLRAARRYRDESFSEVVMRAAWPEDTITGRASLDLLGARRAHMRADELERVDELSQNDQPPEDKWAGR